MAQARRGQGQGQDRDRSRPRRPGPGPGQGPARKTGPFGLRSIGGNDYELTHPRCVDEMELDYEEGMALWREGDAEAARDALRYALQGCGDNLWVHVALGRIALESFRDPSLARGHFGYAFEKAERALPPGFTGACPAVGRRTGRSTRRSRGWRRVTRRSATPTRRRDSALWASGSRPERGAVRGREEVPRREPRIVSDFNGFSACSDFGNEIEPTAESGTGSEGNRRTRPRPDTQLRGRAPGTRNERQE